jgi:hypothetical protein
MSKRTNALVISTIGIDTGKNTLHMIGLDEKGAILFSGLLLSGMGGAIAGFVAVGAPLSCVLRKPHALPTQMEMTFGA